VAVEHSSEEGPAASENPLAAHQAETVATIASGDPVAIKRLYVDLGDGLHSAYGDHLAEVPVLSLPETEPVVVKLFDGVRGIVLDAGCGPNPAVSVGIGRDPARQVVAMDIGLGTVRLARAVAERAGVRLLGLVGDVECLPFRDGAFDGVVCDDTIEHLPDDVAGVAELARVSRPGAPAVLATPNRHNVLILRMRLRDRLAGRGRPASAYFVSNSHLREYTWPEFERLVTGPLRIRGRAPVGWSGSRKRRALTRVVQRGPMHRLSSMIVLVAERA
jgi:SAM-dependent methyltransferase